MAWKEVGTSTNTRCDWLLVSKDVREFEIQFLNEVCLHRYNSDDYNITIAEMKDRRSTWTEV